MVVNDDGEIIDIINQGDRIVRQKSIESYNKEGYTRINGSDNFIKVYTKCLFEIGNELNGRESSMLYYLLQYLRFDDCILAHSNGKLLTRDFIIKDLGQNERTVDRALHGLISKGILGKHKTMYDWTYTINPYIFMKGNKVLSVVAKFYSKTKWANL